MYVIILVKLRFSHSLGTGRLWVRCSALYIDAQKSSMLGLGFDGSMLDLNCFISKDVKVVPTAAISNARH